MNNFERIEADIAKIEKLKSFENLYRVLHSNDKRNYCQYTDDDGSIRYIKVDEFKGAVRHAANRIYELTRNTGEVFIGLKAANSPIWPVAFWALLMAGKKPVLIDARMDSMQVRHIMTQTGTKVIITDTPDTVPPQYKAFDIAEITSYERQSENEPGVAWGDEVALCTSGTTASSKVFLYNGRAICEQLVCIRQIMYGHAMMFVKDPNNIRLLMLLPLHHVLGFIANILWFGIGGASMVFLKDMVPSTILETCRLHRVTHVVGVPLFYNNIVKNIYRTLEQQDEKTQKKFKKAIELSLKLQAKAPIKGRAIAAKLLFKRIHANLLGPDMKLMISGGGRIAPETVRMLTALGFCFSTGYGMTETGITNYNLVTTLESRLSASVGLPLDGVEYKIGTMENAGELLIKGDGLHIGRMEDGRFIPRNLDEWFPTGDVVRVSEDDMWIEGRCKDVIINESGENVYPDELEDEFSDLPYVEQIAVAGVKADSVYEDIVLILQVENRSPEAIEQIADEIIKINGRLPVLKKINRVLVADNELPLANGIKVKRQFVKREIENHTFACQVLDLDEKKLYKTALTKTRKRGEDIPTDDPELEKIKKEVKALFAEVLNMDPADIRDTDSFIEDLGGDSLSSLGVYTKAEEKYNIMLTDTEYLSCRNAYDLSVLLLNKMRGVSTEIKDTETKKGRVKDFAQSREFAELSERLRQSEELGIDNPFFVAHDSALKDTSIVEGKSVLNFGSYNYLGMSGHPRTTSAAIKALEKYGCSASGSRLLAGEKPIHRQLEEELAKWKHCEDALVLVSGHATNVTFVGNFCNKNDLILYDALSHNSIVQGCQLSSADTKAFPHNDYETLEQILKAGRDNYEKVLIVIEGVYSMDGDIAPVPEFVRIKKQYDCFLMVDEAHSACVIGKTGRGVDEYFGLGPDDIDIKMGTLSKGLGACGGYIAGKKEIIQWAKFYLPGFTFSVGLSPALAGAVLEALKMLQEDNSQVAALQRNIKDFVHEAERRGFDICLAKETAIVPVMIGADNDAYLLSELMLKEGVFVPPAVYPAVPRNQARLRFCLISDHNKEQILYALETLDRLARENGIDLKKKI